MANDWRISVFNRAGKWQGFTFAASEGEARAQVAAVRRPGDVAKAQRWRDWAGATGDYITQFTVTDEGETSGSDPGRVVVYTFPNGFRREAEATYLRLRHANLTPAWGDCLDGQMRIELPVREVPWLRVMQHANPAQFGNAPTE